MLTVCCWKWQPLDGFPTQYSADHVNRLQSEVRKHYSAPHRFMCVTDNPMGLHPSIEVVPLWDDLKELSSLNGKPGLSCYRRLRQFASDAGSIFGDRVVSVDLDVAIVGDMSPLWDIDDDFAMCAGFTEKSTYNGTMWLLRTGTRPQVWGDFSPENSPRAAMEAGFVGSDQAWISLSLGPNERKWGRSDGVYSYRIDLKRGAVALPSNARLVSFHGNEKPWNLPPSKMQPWIVA